MQTSSSKDDTGGSSSSRRGEFDCGGHSSSINTSSAFLKAFSFYCSKYLLCSLGCKGKQRKKKKMMTFPTNVKLETNQKSYKKQKKVSSFETKQRVLVTMLGLEKFARLSISFCVNAVFLCLTTKGHKGATKLVLRIRIKNKSRKLSHLSKWLHRKQAG